MACSEFVTKIYTILLNLLTLVIYTTGLFNPYWVGVYKGNDIEHSQNLFIYCDANGCKTPDPHYVRYLCGALAVLTTCAYYGILLVQVFGMCGANVKWPKIFGILYILIAISCLVLAILLPTTIVPLHTMPAYR
ncbi:uncharacterized protein LOC131942107 [Physella acuta]|uniref:uncharacterized protein LOC131942107 n=1 Tax=Physella acuta TaxID=109671 RepID=UPI0027DBC604|nr:uncharacterized protein LOC131942107 [Physella acuta]